MTVYQLIRQLQQFENMGLGSEEVEFVDDEGQRHSVNDGAYRTGMGVVIS